MFNKKTSQKQENKQINKDMILIDLQTFHSGIAGNARVKPRNLLIGNMDARH